MNVGDVLRMAAEKDLAAIGKKNELDYSEYLDGVKFTIRLKSKFEEANLECQLPDFGTEEERNYLRLHFLSMVFNSAIYGMRRLKKRKSKLK